MSVSPPSESSGSLLLAGAYALLVPGGRGVALPWPPVVRTRVRPSQAWRLSVRDGGGVREASVEALAAVAGRLGPYAIELDFGANPAGGTSALACLAIAREFDADGAAALTRALGLHRALQGGRGSGYDVTVSALRRPVALETDAAGLARATPLSAAPALEVLVATGPKRGLTADWIARFEAVGRERPRDVAELVEGTSCAADGMRGALERGEAPAMAEALRDLSGLRPLVNDLLGGPYGAPLDDALVTAAKRLDVPAHPSGAAGDTWLAAHPDPGRLDALALAWRPLGVRVFRAACGAPSF